MVADPIVPIPPAGYGGTERVVGYLIEELASRGVPLTLVAAEGSRSPGRLKTVPDARHRPRIGRGVAKLNYWRILRTEIRRHDVIHSVVRLDYLWPALQSRIPKVLNFQNHVDAAEMARVQRESRGPLVLTACGSRMIEDVRHLGDWRAVHNAVPVHDYLMGVPETPAYVVFLGRITKVKGAHTAMRAALAADMNIKIAGPIGTAAEDAEYFAREVEPLLAHPRVHYVGEVGDDRKGELLGGAVALLNPIEWDEPFGIVNVEALACGTPVISYPRGEIPFILEDGVTGILVEDEQEMSDAIRSIDMIDRATCREHAEKRFDISVMTDRYIAIYEELLSR